MPASTSTSPAEKTKAQAAETLAKEVGAFLSVVRSFGGEEFLTVRVRVQLTPLRQALANYSQAPPDDVSEEG